MLFMVNLLKVSGLRLKYIECQGIEAVKEAGKEHKTKQNTIGMN